MTLSECPSFVLRQQSNLGVVVASEEAISGSVESGSVVLDILQANNGIDISPMGTIHSPMLCVPQIVISYTEHLAPLKFSQDVVTVEGNVNISPAAHIHTMGEALNVIALISGGKDSFFSVIHCIRNGHRIVALANLHPPIASIEGEALVAVQDERDLDSYMYQTAGHSIVPHYQKALNLPLYRQPILGSAVDDGLTYTCTPNTDAEHDETESLTSLLRHIVQKHPQANALCSGAILSTYQRTRIESVAGRQGLVSLAYLWQYPVLPFGTQTSMLEELAASGLEARIVKVASGGLDESFLWEDVASEQGRLRLETTMSRFGGIKQGTVLGEGGEFETVVVDGPGWLFKKRIDIEAGERREIKGEGGSAWLALGQGRLFTKNEDKGILLKSIKKPSLLAERFERILKFLLEYQVEQEALGPLNACKQDRPNGCMFQGGSLQEGTLGIRYLTVTGTRTEPSTTFEDEALGVVASIRDTLATAGLDPSDIISTTVILRSMQDFAVINKIYSALFNKPNPPSRVTFSLGSLLPTSSNLTIHLRLIDSSIFRPSRKTLHVQSISYWAPANIGPYSQAVSVQIHPTASSPEETVFAVSTAGQIPLVSHTMEFPTPDMTVSLLGSNSSRLDNFKIHAILALQHLWTIGLEVKVSWWTSVVAYLPRQSDGSAAREKAVLAGKAWSLLHQPSVEDEVEDEFEEIDLWADRFNALVTSYDRAEVKGEGRSLPDWSIVTSDQCLQPPFFAVEVEELPRGSEIEWNAIMGIDGGLVQLRSRHGTDRWRVHQCITGMMVQTLVMLYDQEDTSLASLLQQALEEVEVDAGEQKSHASYVDLSADTDEWLNRAGGIIPCVSIWDDAGRRLAAVMLFDTLPNI